MLMTWNESLKEFYIWADSQEAYLPREIGFKRIKKVWTTKNISIAKEFTFYARDKALLTCLRSHKPQSNYAQPYPVKSSENMLKNSLAYLGFQTEGIEAALSKRNFLIADQQGTGKTIQTCGYITSLPVEKRFLIICPASMRLTWKKEIDKWTDHEAHIIRKGFVSQNHKIQIINFDILKKNLDKLISRGFDVIVVDEFHLAKNPLAQRTDCVIQLTKQSERNLFLSGTPFPNSLKESFHLFNMISDEYFNSFYFHERNLKLHSNDFMIRRTRKEVLKDLPEKIRKFIYIPQDKKLSKYCFDELQAYSKKHGWVESIKFEDFSRAKREAAKLKFPLMIDSAEEMWFNCREEDGRMVIFTYHLDIANQLQEHFNAKGLITAVYNGETSENHKNAIVDDFQAGKIDILIASIRSAGVGLTLTRATHVLFCELDYRPDIIEQSEDRCYRYGSEKNVLIWYLIVENSFDEHMVDAIKKKQKDVNKLMEQTTL